MTSIKLRAATILAPTGIGGVGMRMAASVRSCGVNEIALSSKWLREMMNSYVSDSERQKQRRRRLAFVSVPKRLYAPAVIVTSLNLNAT